MTPRDIDHLVIALKDFERGRAAFARLGFTVSPATRHASGIVTSFVQFATTYLELVGLDEGSSVRDIRYADVSLAAFNREFLGAAEGISMVACKSADVVADGRDFANRGLPHFKPVNVEHWFGTDGDTRKIAFAQAFTSEPRLPEAGFFTCQNNSPDNFWRSEFQSHPNGALAIDSVVLVAPDPADFHEFLTYFTGQHDMRSTSLGVSFDLGDSRFDVLSPVGFKGLFGEDVGERLHRFAACRLAVADLTATRQILEAANIPHREISRTLIVPASHTHGVALGFVEAT